MTAGFWIAAGALLMMVLVVLALPLWRHRAASGRTTRDANLDVYYQRRQELQEEVATGLLTATAAEEAQAELDQQLLDDTRDDEPVRAVRSSALMLAAVLVLVPVVALWSWLEVRAPLETITETAPSSPAEADPGQLRQMVGELEQRLADEPGDAMSWLLLGRVYMALGEPDRASSALGEAASLLPDQPRVLTDYAESLAATQGEDGWRGRPYELLQAALQVDPEYGRALWLAGVAAEQRDDFTAAAAYWQRLLEQEPADSDTARLLRQYIDEMRQQADP